MNKETSKKIRIIIVGDMVVDCLRANNSRMETNIFKAVSTIKLAIT